MKFTEGCRADVTGGCWSLLTYSAVIVTENHLRFVIGRPIAWKRLNFYKLCALQFVYTCSRLIPNERTPLWISMVTSTPVAFGTAGRAGRSVPEYQTAIISERLVVQVELSFGCWCLLSVLTFTSVM